jgi:hypothetical protein
MAAWFHVLQGIQGSSNLSHIVLSVAIATVLLVPGRAEGLLFLSAAGLWAFWTEAPEVSNHWTISALVNLAILLATAGALVRRRPGDVDRYLFPAARWSLLGFYSFAAFAKLNADFFDPAVSCATFFVERSTRSLGLGGLGLHEATGVRWAVIFGTAIVEASVPLLLLVRRTRPYGVLVALVFHALLALDLDLQFTNFSSMLTALFLLFLPPTFATGLVGAVTRRWDAAHARFAIDPQRTGRVVAILVGVVAAGGELVVFDTRAVYRLAYLVWQPFVAVLVVAVAVHLRRGRRTGSVPVQPIGRPVAWMALVPLVVVAYGLTPYLEVKTASSWNMYANLRTAGGDSNHFIVRATWPLTHQQTSPITILETDHPGLQKWADDEYAFAPQTLAYYLQQRPSTAITYERDGRVVTLARASDDPALIDPGSEVRRKLQFFTQIDRSGAQRCKW